MQFMKDHAGINFLKKISKVLNIPYNLKKIFHRILNLLYTTIGQL